MKFRPLVLLLPFVLWQCATPPVAPKPPSQPPVILGPDDDHRLVGSQEFSASAWTSTPSVVSWEKIDGGVSFTLVDGRVATFTFVTPSVVRWWVPAAKDDRPLSPGAVYPATSVSVRVKPSEGMLALESTGLGAQIKLADLSWTLVRGEKTILATVAGPQRAGRRLLQSFRTTDAVRWFGAQGSAIPQATHSWADDQENADGRGPFPIPTLFGAGGSAPFALVLDNSYQCYTQISSEKASLGALNGGLDLLIASSAQPASVVESISSLMGRTATPPLWAHGTALALSAAETGEFLRKAKLSVQTAEGPFRGDRIRFQSLVPQPATQPKLPDLTSPAQRESWSTRLPLIDNAGAVLEARSSRQDWDTGFGEPQKPLLLASVGNQLSGLEALAYHDQMVQKSPGRRPLLLSGGGGLGSARNAIPRLTVSPNERTAIARVLWLGVAGLGTPSIRLDLTALGAANTRRSAFNALGAWILSPYLTLDWGNAPQVVWASLPEPDQKRLRSLLELRSQFRPLFAQLARQTQATGRPAWSPVWFLAPADPLALERDDEFLLGDGILVAPCDEGAKRKVYLPGPGVWFDFWSGEEYEGGQAFEVEGRANKPLVFARGGAFVPLREAEIFDDKDVYNPMTIHVFPGGRGVGTYWLDDGVTSSEGGAWETRLSFDYEEKLMVLEHDLVGTTSRVRPDPYLLYRIHLVFPPKSVKIDGKAIPLFGNSWGITDTDRSAAWYESDKSLLIKTFRPERSQEILINF